MYELYVKQKVFKITDHYEVMNEGGEPVYYVDQDFKFIGNTVHVQKADNTSSFVIDKEIFTLMPRYTVSFADGKSMRIQQNFTFFKKDIDIISDNYSLNLRGNFWDMDFGVYYGETEVGSIRQKYITWGDTFVITVIDPAYEEELVALLIAVDNIKDNEQSNR